MKRETFSDPYIIAIETATQVSSVALFSGSRLIGSLEYPAGNQHAKLITVMMETLLRDLEIPKSALQAVAISKGPGSYTGLRVGVSTAKGLAMALDLPLISFNSLEGIAWQLQDFAEGLGAFICPMIDARRMEVYCALFDTQLANIHPTEAKVIEKDAFSTILEERKVIFAGNGAAKCKEVLTQSPNAIVLSNIGCTATQVGDLIWKKFQAQEFEDLVTFEPFYLKEFVAIKAKNPLKPQKVNK